MKQREIYYVLTKSMLHNYKIATDGYIQP